jgi:hypothetical protein
MYEPSFFIYPLIEMLIVGIIAVKIREIPTLLFGVIMAIVAITMFNFSSPFSASYLSPLALTAFLSWLVYIWLVRLCFKPKLKKQASENETQ